MTHIPLTPYIDKATALGAFIDDNEGTKYFQHGGPTKVSGASMLEAWKVEMV